MNAKDEGQQVIKPVPLRLLCPACGHQHVDVDESAARLHRTHLCDQCGHEWAPSQDYTVGVARALAYCEDLSALQQQVTELEEERDEAKHLLEQSLLELDARIEEQADYMEVVKKQQQALLVLKAWIKSSKEDAATVNYEGIAQIVNEAYEAAETLTSPSTAQEEQR